MEANLLNIPQVTQLFFRFDFSFNPGFAVINIFDQYSFRKQCEEIKQTD